MRIIISRLFLGLILISAAYGQDINALNGYKYIYFPTIKWSDGRVDPYGIARKIGQYFSEKGFIIFDENSPVPKEIQDDPCLALTFTGEARSPGVGSESITIILKNCKNEVVFSGKGKTMGMTAQGGMNSAIKKALAPVNSLVYRFDIDKAPTFESPEIEITSETEETITAYLDSQQLDPIEGIYNSYQSEAGPFYKLGIVKKEDRFRAIIIESSSRSWRPGEVKALLEKSSMSHIYAAKWFTQDKTKQDTFATMENEGVLSIEIRNTRTGEKSLSKFVKMYPPVSDSGKSKPEGDSATGSGFFISKSGVIATNAHLIEGGKSIEIAISNELGNLRYKAKVLLSDNKNDVALIQIDDDIFKGISSIPYGFVERADPGEKVFTIGYPLNDIMGSNYKVTDGIISAKSGIGDDVRYFQITVPLQPGNSGGPLFNKDADIIGITSSSLNPEAVGAEVENVNYAVKISYLINLYNMLPNLDKLPVSTNLNSKQLQDQVKILKNYVCLITVNR